MAKKGRKPLPRRTISTDSWIKLMNYVSNKRKVCVNSESWSDYIYGYSDKNNVYYVDEYALIMQEWEFSEVLGLEYDLSGCWRQFVLILDKEQDEPITKDNTISPIQAVIKINGIIKKYYTKEEKEEIFQSHECDSADIIHNSIQCERNTILKFTNSYYYDLNGAYASALIELFPKCEKEFTYLFEHRHDNNNKYKNCFNYYVGCLTENNESRKYKEDNDEQLRTIYPKTRFWIVNRTTKKMYEMLSKMESDDSILIYANTDGFMIQNPKIQIDNSKKAGEFKLEYQGDIYTYRSNNYTIVQYGDEIKGSCLKTVRNAIDLRQGKVVKYDRIKANGTFKVENYEEIIVNEIEEIH